MPPLGSGEFGIVYSGTFKNTSVAIKTTQPDAEVEYFRAMLKELKVMIHIGKHENIVNFLGFNTEYIRKGKKCIITNSVHIVVSLLNLHK